MQGTKRMWGAGAVFGTAITSAALLATVGQTAGDELRGIQLTFANASGVQRTITTAPRFDVANPFFQEIGTNGRTCLSCHQPAQAWTITPEEVRRRTFVIDNVGGLNGAPQDPLGAPIRATCTICHDTPNAGNHSISMPLNLGLTSVSRRTPDLPLYTLQNRSTLETVQTTDPGRAMVTGKWDDVGKFKGPILRALAARAPYFHNGAAATLEEAVESYDTRFNIRLTHREKADLVAFLKAL